jgi:hypothetical protein
MGMVLVGRFSDVMIWSEGKRDVRTGMLLGFRSLGRERGEGVMVVGSQNILSFLSHTSSIYHQGGSITALGEFRVAVDMIERAI